MLIFLREIRVGRMVDLTTLDGPREGEGYWSGPTERERAVQARPKNVLVTCPFFFRPFFLCPLTDLGRGKG